MNLDTHKQLSGVFVFFHNALHVVNHPSFRRPADAEGVFDNKSIQAEVDTQVFQFLWLEMRNTDFMFVTQTNSHSQPEKNSESWARNVILDKKSSKWIEHNFPFKTYSNSLDCTTAWLDSQMKRKEALYKVVFNCLIIGYFSASLSWIFTFGGA